MVLDKVSGKIEHKHFFDIVDYLNEGDCLVLNDTKVIPARLIGEKEGTGAKVEFLLLTRKSEKTWEVLVKPGKKCKAGTKVLFGNGKLTGEIKEVLLDGNRIAEFSYEGLFENVLDELGEMPLPPYITQKLADKDRYQTVYSKNTGSSAAPTAGLHFTNELLSKIKEKGVNIAYVTLHVGLGTFRPVKVEDVKNHHMHSEYYYLSKENADIINKTRLKGSKVISVGTTSTRVLETIADKNGVLKEQSGWTDIFIYPPYKFKCVNSLITNFHLPESTLLMLVSAFSSKEFIMDAYREAVDNKYRFFSFGDAMFIE